MRQRGRALRSVLPQILLLVGLGSVLFFLGLGRVALLDPDEPYYAVPALEMMRSGTWLVTLLHDRPWFDKPIFYYWTILGAYKVLGVSEVTTRLSSALAGLAGVLALFAWGRRSGMSSGGRALAPAIILGTSLEYALLSRAAVTDMTLTLFLTLGMLAVARSLETDRLTWASAGGLAFGLAILTKGPIGLILPMAALASYAVLARSSALLQPARLAAVTAGALVSAGPWFAYMALAHRDLLVQTFLGTGNLGRFLDPEHRSIPCFYAVVLLAGLFPWSGALPAALIATARSSLSKREPLVKRDPVFSARTDAPNTQVSVGPLYALCWFGSVLLVFSLSASKLSTYILPAFPPAALMLGEFWSSVLSPSSRSHRDHVSRSLPPWALVSGVAGIVVSVLIAAAAILMSHTEWGVTSSLAIGIGVLVLAGGLGSLRAIRRRSLPEMLTTNTVMVCALVLAFVFIAGPRLDGLRSTRSMVRDLQTGGWTDEVIGAYRERDFSQDFYLGKTLPRARNLKALKRQVRLHPGGLWLVPSSNLSEVTSERTLRVEIVASRPKTVALRIDPSNPGRSIDARPVIGTRRRPFAEGRFLAALMTPGRNPRPFSLAGDP